MILATANTDNMVIIVSFIWLSVSTNTLPKSFKLAFWIRPPIIAEIKIHTPGVLIQEKVITVGFSPVYIVVCVAKTLKASLIGITILLVSNKNTKIRINGHQATNALDIVMFSCLVICISYCGSLFFLDANRIVNAKEHTLPTTTASSAPTK